MTPSALIIIISIYFLFYFTFLFFLSLLMKQLKFFKFLVVREMTMFHQTITRVIACVCAYVQTQSIYNVLSYQLKLTATRLKKATAQ